MDEVQKKNFVSLSTDVVFTRCEPRGREKLDMVGWLWQRRRRWWWWW